MPPRPPPDSDCLEAPPDQGPRVSVATPLDELPVGWRSRANSLRKNMAWERWPRVALLLGAGARLEDEARQDRLADGLPQALTQWTQGAVGPSNAVGSADPWAALRQLKVELLDFRGTREPRPPWHEAERAFTAYLTRVMGRPLPVGDLGWAIKDTYEFGSPWSDLTPRLVARLHTSWDVGGGAADWPPRGSARVRW